MRKIAMGAAAGLLALSSMQANALSGQEGYYRWPQAKIPYTFSSGGLNFKDNYCDAVQHWENNTSVDFVYVGDPEDKCDWDNNIEDPNNYPVQARLASGLGCYVTPPGYPFPTYTDGVLNSDTKDVVISSSCAGGDSIQGAVHELGHLLGFIHEQNRYDAGDYIVYIRENAAPGTLASQFTPRDNSEGYTLTDYDYFSVMHYHLTQAGKDNPDAEPDQPWTFKLKTLDIPEEDRVEFYALNPNFQEDLYKRNGLAASDIAGFEAYYAPGIADLHSDIEEVSFCHSGDYDEGSCDTLRELVVETTVTNLGPWAANDVQIVHTLPAKAHSEFDTLNILASNAESCNKSSIDICADAACEDLNLAEKIAACSTGSASSCLSEPAVICTQSTMAAPQAITTRYSLIDPDEKKGTYSVAVLASGTDDVASNDSASGDDYGYRSCGCSGCPESSSSSVAAADPTLPSIVLLAMGFLYRNRRKH